MQWLWLWRGRAGFPVEVGEALLRAPPAGQTGLGQGDQRPIKQEDFEGIIRRIANDEALSIRREIQAVFKIWRSQMEKLGRACRIPYNDGFILLHAGD